LNELDYIPALMASMAHVMEKIEAAGGMASSVEELIGLNNVAQHITDHIEILAKDEDNKAIVKEFGDQLGKLNNMLKAYGQRMAEKKQKSNGGLDPEVAAKIQATMVTAQAKAQNTKTAHAQWTAQRQVQFELEQNRKDQQTQAEIARENAKALSDIRNETMRARFKNITDE
jgi:ribosomal protein S15P/S13E